jgi:hypothetical protein
VPSFCHQVAHKLLCLRRLNDVDSLDLRAQGVDLALHIRHALIVIACSGCNLAVFFRELAVEPHCAAPDGPSETSENG